jgi:uncharacterized protein (DUF1697 family)
LTLFPGCRYRPATIRARMNHYVAFLRGINLGNRRLKMDRLRVLFEEMKFTEVTTFIASGNVIFASKVAHAGKLEKRIQDHLHKSLGYAVDTFVRTRAEVAAVAAFRPFARADWENPANRVYVGFLQDALHAGQVRKFLACRTEVDELRVAGREYYWLCRVRSIESTVWTSPAMRAVKLPTSSMRNLTTVRKLATQHPAPAA